MPCRRRHFRCALQQLPPGLLLLGRPRRSVPAVPSGILRVHCGLNGGHLHCPVQCKYVFAGRRHQCYLHCMPSGSLLRAWRAAADRLPPRAVCDRWHLRRHHLRGGHVLPGRPPSTPLPRWLLLGRGGVRVHCVRGGQLPRNQQHFSVGESVHGRLLLPIHDGGHVAGAVPCGLLLPRWLGAAHAVHHGLLLRAGRWRPCCVPRGLLLQRRRGRAYGVHFVHNAVHHRHDHRLS